MLQNILDYRIDAMTFAFVCFLALAVTHLRLRRLPNCPGITRTSWVMLTLLVMLGGFLAEFAENFERDRLRKMVEGLAPTYALELEHGGHSEIGIDTPPDDPRYLALIDRQKFWLKVNSTVSDIYTFRRQSDGTIALLVDSETDYDHNGKIEGDDEQRAQIGEPYATVTEDLLAAYSGQQSFDSRPYTDRWGTWVSALVPIRDSSGEVEAVLGVDYAAADWLQAIVVARGGALGIVFILVVILVASYAIMARQRAELISRRLNEQLLRSKTDELTKYTVALESARAELEEAARAKSQFLANMSHEIRTPLNGVIGMLELLQGTPLDTVQTRFARTARISADCLLSLINDVLDFSKIEAGKLELDETDFDLHTLLEDVSEMFAARAEKKNVELCLYIKAEVPSAVRGDPDRLRQIVINLVTNAIKFTQKGQIVIRAELADRTDDETVIRVSIQDSGIGIPRERMDRLFKSFSQVDASTTRKYGGTGLGLAVSKQLTELFGGEIGVESEVGRGTTFFFTVRLRHATNLTDGRVVPQVLRNLRVLVVDDNQTNREILQANFRGWGFECAIAHHAAHALDILRKSIADGLRFDLAVVDMQMPEMDGLQLIERIRLNDQFEKMRLIMLTSLSNTISREKLSELGLSCYLTKPVRQSRLFDAVIETAMDSKSDGGIKSPTEPQDAGRVPTTRISAHVLLAEDNEINQFVAIELLRRAGFTCDAVQNGLWAIEAVRSGKYDVVLMDCQMPVMDGFEATRAIRDEERESGTDLHIPIIALTANAVKGDREACLAAGMDDYVTKPINPPTLVSAIERSLSGRMPVVKETIEPRVETSDQPTSEPVVVKSSNDQKVATSPSKSPVPHPINAPEFLKNCMGDSQIGRQVLQMLPASIENQFITLQAALKSLDNQGVVRASHTIKGLAANVAAEELRSLAAGMERKGKDGDLVGVAAAVSGLRDELDRCMSAIPELLKEISA